MEVPQGREEERFRRLLFLFRRIATDYERQPTVASNRGGPGVSVDMQATFPFTIQRSAERALNDHGWLQTYHSFSFADYHDPSNINWGALRVFNDDVIAPGMGFGTHPHRDMEILTYVLDGELEHRDSMGNIGVVRPGGVQYLSAGTGIRHSEYNHLKAQSCRLVQMWIMPHAQGLEPRYGQVDFTLADRESAWLIIASGREDVAAPIAIWQDASCFVTQVREGERQCAIDAGRFGFLFVAKGSVDIRDNAGNTASLQEGDALRITGASSLAFQGTGELVLWDVPAFVS